MQQKLVYWGYGGLVVLAVVSLLVGTVAVRLPGEVKSAQAAGADLSAAEQEAAEPAAEAALGTLVMSYAAKFVCTEPLQPGQQYLGAVAPIVKEKTEVLLHNPHDFAVKYYLKAVRASSLSAPPVAPGAWTARSLDPDRAVRADCDDITRLLTGNPAATFIGTFGIGVTVEGFVVVEVGPQTTAAGGRVRYSPLDVTAEYARSSEVLKKDIHYQPWWIWWWWGLPWRLGYAYNRVILAQATSNVDCRAELYNALHQDAERDITDPTQLNLTHLALNNGQAVDPTRVTQLSNETPYGLVAVIGGCRKLFNSTGGLVLDIDYALFSNKGPSDLDPRTPNQDQSAAILYPWIPGRWYDLPVVMPQNISTDVDDYFHRWFTQRWIDAGALASDVQVWMPYYFPYWCGWGYWWGWWNAGDCVDIGVGEGESLDVEQVTPQRVFMTIWPPVP